jgi:hypothetical protein
MPARSWNYITGEIIFAMPTHINVGFSELVYTIFLSKESFLLLSYSIIVNKYNFYITAVKFWLFYSV